MFATRAGKAAAMWSSDTWTPFASRPEATVASVRPSEPAEEPAPVFVARQSGVVAVRAEGRREAPASDIVADVPAGEIRRVPALAERAEVYVVSPRPGYPFVAATGEDNRVQRDTV